MMTLLLTAVCLPGKKGGPKDLSDDAVYDMVRRKLANDRDVKGGNLTVEVKNGVVTISGAMESDKFRQKAEKIARKTAGVKQVVNKITVRPVR
jgi:hyperosmotically inducible periplasmic protein